MLFSIKRSVSAPTKQARMALWEPVHRILFTNSILGIENVGGDLDAVTGKRVTFAFFPWNWDRGDGCIIRLVAMIDKSQGYRIESGASFA